MRDQKEGPGDGVSHPGPTKEINQPAQNTPAHYSAQRRRLPNRREHQVIEFDLDNVHYTAGISRFETGEVAEVFFHRIGKTGSSAERIGRDLGVAASLCLQSGVSVAQLRHCLERLRDGSASGPLGKLFDLLDAAQ